ncbi:hypothetical protein OG912_12450 [Streptomyces sp. NBC_00464]|uniref:hypothetical protein n=1 Tax=Streptomyces sp. NBC_00464 TaxID=2975751 RepID=UPI002E177B73
MEGLVRSVGCGQLFELIGVGGRALRRPWLWAAVPRGVRGLPLGMPFANGKVR